MEAHAYGVMPEGNHALWVWQLLVVGKTIPNRDRGGFCATWTKCVISACYPTHSRGLDQGMHGRDALLTTHSEL